MNWTMREVTALILRGALTTAMAVRNGLGKACALAEGDNSFQ